MEITPKSLYVQAVDKQRIAIIGSKRKLIGEIILHVLKHHNRKADYATDTKSDINPTSAPMIIYETERPDLEQFQHHIVILSSGAVNHTEAICNNTPKSGVIIFPDDDSALKTIATKERVDVSSISYKPYKHERIGNQFVLISSEGKKFPVRFNSDEELEAAGAAKELLKKIGITSAQFYQAIQTFE